MERTGMRQIQAICEAVSPRHIDGAEEMSRTAHMDHFSLFLFVLYRFIVRAAKRC